MQSIVEASRSQLEEVGEYVVRANISSGWFAMYPETWRSRLAVAAGSGREGPNLIVYRTRSGDPRDHHVIPYEVLQELIVDETLSSSKRGTIRWNLALHDHQLRVTHRRGKLDVKAYHRSDLVIEDGSRLMGDEVTPAEVYCEGAVQRIEVNAFERDRAARLKCISHYGPRCSVCSMSFADVYGDQAESIIHVHHLVELSTIRQRYVVDPIKDLRPVCPNCHAVIHSRRPAFSIEEVATMVRTSGQVRIPARA